MWEVANVLDEMTRAGVVTNYAIFGAIAQTRYTEPVATIDVDVLVGIPDEGRLDVLGGIYSYLQDRGYRPEKEAVRIGSWPVQFIPAYDELTKEAMSTAETDDFEGTPLRVVRADYLALLALSAGRNKDFIRVLDLIESGSVTPGSIAELASRHGMGGLWERFKTRFLDGC